MKTSITEGLIKELNALILSDVKFTPAQDKNGNVIQKKARVGRMDH